MRNKLIFFLLILSLPAILTAWIEKKDYETRVEKFAKSVAVMQMFSTNKVFSKQLYGEVQGDFVKVVEFYKEKYGKWLGELRRHGATLGPKEQESLKLALHEGWQRGSENALFLLDYANISKIKEDYKNAIDEAEGFVRDFKK